MTAVESKMVDSSGGAIASIILIREQRLSKKKAMQKTIHTVNTH